MQYAMSTPEDLAQTAKEVEDLDRRIVTRQADVRDKRRLQEAFDAGVAELGRVDIILANAGIANQVGGDPTTRRGPGRTSSTSTSPASTTRCGSRRRA